jgi:hypothetical protein
MKTITRIIVAGLTLLLLGITCPVLALPNFNAPLNGLGVPGLAPIGPGLPPEPQPTPPTILQKTTNSVKLEWEDHFSNETGNILERRQPGGPWVFLADLGPVHGAGSYTDPPEKNRDCTKAKGGVPHS